ncbi:hypothetical protein [Aliiroseovarius sp. YM-037]|uniref:hypothetical protein n=1 Tax=Aliiroseovarius sp. YM-037 TaxID=3341728 RepID=UPI003A80E204
MTSQNAYQAATDRPQATEAALLFQAIDMAELPYALANVAAALGADRDDLGATHANFDLPAQNTRVEVVALQTPIGAAEFHGVLDTSTEHTNIAEATTFIRGHRHHIHVSVVSKDAGASSASDAQLDLCCSVLCTLIDTLSPSAVLWGQSSRLLSTAEFVKLAKAVDPLALYLHPKAGKDGAFHINGAERFIGKSITVMPEGVPLDDAMAQVCDLIRAGQDDPDRVNLNDTFALESGHKIHIRHTTPTPQQPLGGLELTNVVAGTSTKLRARPEGRTERPQLQLVPTKAAPAEVVETPPAPRTEDALRDVFRANQKRAKATEPQKPEARSSKFSLSLRLPFRASTAAG